MDGATGQTRIEDRADSLIGSPRNIGPDSL